MRKISFSSSLTHLWVTCEKKSQKSKFSNMTLNKTKFFIWALITFHIEADIAESEEPASFYLHMH